MRLLVSLSLFFFFFNDTATTEIYSLSLHDALPIWTLSMPTSRTTWIVLHNAPWFMEVDQRTRGHRSEEHTSELQSRPHLVCRLLLEKKNRTSHKGLTTPPLGVQIDDDLVE